MMKKKCHTGRVDKYKKVIRVEIELIIRPVIRISEMRKGAWNLEVASSKNIERTRAYASVSSCTGILGLFFDPNTNFEMISLFLDFFST